MPCLRGLGCPVRARRLNPGESSVAPDITNAHAVQLLFTQTGCGRDHAAVLGSTHLATTCAACHRTGAQAQGAFRTGAGEAVGSDGHVVPQPRFVNMYNLDALLPRPSRP